MRGYLQFADLTTDYFSFFSYFEINSFSVLFLSFWLILTGFVVTRQDVIDGNLHSLETDRTSATGAKIPK